MRFKRMTAEGEMEWCCPTFKARQFLSSCGRVMAIEHCVGVTFGDGRQLLLFETVDGTSSDEALQIGSEMRAKFRSGHYVSTLVEPTTKQ
jgi:hypothetical protein